MVICKITTACLCCLSQKFNFLFYCSVQNNMKLILPVSHVFTYSLQFSLLSYCGERNQVYVLLLCVTECVFLLEWTGILHLFIPISKTSIPVCERKSFCLPVVCIEFLYPLIRLLLLARKQSKYNRSLSGPPRHWFIHSLLQVGVTNPRGSQPIHTTKI